MSDADNATPDRSRVSGCDDVRESSTLTPPSPQNPAPWERWRSPSRHTVATGQRPPGSHAGMRVEAPEVSDKHSRSAGAHADGRLTVAELIAKVGAPPRPELDPGARQPRRQPEPASEIPDLDELLPRRPPTVDPSAIADDDERTTELPVLAPPPDEEATPAEHPPSGHRGLLVAGRVMAALIAVLALAATGGAWQWSSSKNNRLNTVSALDPDSHDIIDPHGQYGDENFLIVGADTRAGANSGMGAGDTEETGGARSDTIMLVNIPAGRQRVVAVSFPRDLAVKPMYCQAWNPETGAYGPVYDEQSGTYSDNMVYTETKLNSTYSFGGPKCLVKEIQKLSGLSINRFMAVDFAGFAKMVDALGGVEVCSQNALYDYELGTLLDQAGRQVIDGATALNYVRGRSVTTEFNGDYGRIKRQQRFVSSLLRALISTDTLFSPIKLNNVVDMFINDSYVDNVKTKDLVSLGQSLQGVSAGRITFVTIPTGETDENGDEPPRTSDMRALFDAIIDDDPLPGENDQGASATSTTAAPPPGRAAQSQGDQVQLAATAPEDVTVQVFNSTSESGLATTASDALQQRGFTVLSPDDYPSALKSTTVLFSPGNEQAAATVASAFGNAPIQRVKGKGQVVQVVLGPDFRWVNAPAPPGTPVNVPVTRAVNSPPVDLPEDLTVTNAADTTCE